MVDRQDLSDRAAGGEAHDVRARNLQRVHEAEHVVGHLLHRVAHHRPVALAGAAMVVDDGAVARRERRQVGRPEGADAAETRDQQHRLAGAVGFVGEADAVEARDGHVCAVLQRAAAPDCAATLARRSRCPGSRCSGRAPPTSPRGSRPRSGCGFTWRKSSAVISMPGRAEAALQPVVLVEGLLQRMELAAVGQALDRADLGAVGLHREHGARARRLAVDEIVHAPQMPCSQPTCVPVRPRSSRRKSTSSLRGSQRPSRVAPLTVRRTLTSSVMRGAARSGPPQRDGAGDSTPVRWRR